MAGFVERLDYDMYDVAIHIKNADEIPSEAKKNLHFNIIYISKDYTLAQITMRLSYCAISTILFMGYATKVLCRVPDSSKKHITEEQWQLLGLSILLIFFNDPFYVLAVLDPSFLKLVINHLFMSVFVAAMLIFWLRINLKLTAT